MLLFVFQIILRCWALWLYFQHFDSDRGRSSRYGSSSRKAVIPSGKTGSSGEYSEARVGRLVSSTGRPSTTQRVQQTYSRTPARGTRDDPLRSFELLTIRK